MQLKFRICFFFILIHTLGISQTIIHGVVKDPENKEALSFCPFIVKGTQKSGLSNEDGEFTAIVRSENDTLVFSYINYYTAHVPVRSLLLNNTILLKRKTNLLKEVVVYAKNDRLYKILDKCRKTLLKGPEYVSKAYLEVETERDGSPVNMLETYYNATTKTCNFKELKIKNGRAGLAQTEDLGYFVSDDASKAISMFSLIDRTDYFPGAPFHLALSRLKKIYELQIISETDESYLISFKPKKEKEEYFKGEVWIDKASLALLKINLICKNTERHPFVPFKGGKISNFSMYISQTFTEYKDHKVLSLIKFAYAQDYSNNKPEARINNGTDLTTRFNTECLMYLYDHEKPFTLPFFNYDDKMSDYRKICFLPFNKVFWNQNEGLLKTEKQNQKLEFFNKNGFLFNHNFKFGAGSGEKARFSNKEFFEDNYEVWADSTRLFYKFKEPAQKLPSDFVSVPGMIQKDPVKLKAQIYLDLNLAGDSIQHYSITVFDVFETYYQLQKDDNSDCFINLFFDIAEIERRKMEQSMKAFPNNLDKITVLYNQTMKDLEAQTYKFTKETEYGRNADKMLKWNSFVKENLGIDNLEIFKPVEKKHK